MLLLFQLREFLMRFVFTGYWSILKTLFNIIHFKYPKRDTHSSKVCNKSFWCQRPAKGYE